MAATNQGAPKVLQVLGSLNTGGAEMAIVAAAEELQGKCRIDYLVFDRHPGTLEERALAGGGQVHRLRRPSALTTKRFVTDLQNLLMDARYDAVHTHINLASGWVVLAADSAGVPIRIAHSHSDSHTPGSPLRQIYAWIARRLLRRHSTTLAACSVDAGHGLFGTAWTDSCIVIPNGVAVGRFLAARELRSAVRDELDLAPATRAVGVIARLAPVKNHQFMLDVMALDEARGGDTVLFVIGDGPLRQALENRVLELGLVDRVRFLGVRHDVPRLLGAMDLMAMPSLHEGIPVSLIECQAAGVPAIVSDRVSRHSDRGLGLITWLSLDRPEAWQERIAAIVTPPTKDEIVKRFAEDAYDLHSSAAKLLSLYVGPSEK